MQVNLQAKLVKNTVNAKLKEVARQALKEASNNVIQDFQNKFIENQKSWAKLAQSTIRQKDRKLGPHLILVWTGELRKTVVRQVVIENDGFTLHLINDDVIALSLNNGSSKHNLPARPFFYLNEKDAKKVTLEFAKALKRLWKS